MNRHNTGFTLIELMIVVAIIAILAAIAYPSYVNYVQQNRRSDAQSDLVELANFMERFYSNHGSYDLSSENKQLPFNTTPRSATGSNVYYNITLKHKKKKNNKNNYQKYKLIATPANDQSGDSCGVLTLTQTGEKDSDGSGCW